jgi:hypothetical protein
MPHPFRAVGLLLNLIGSLLLLYFPPTLRLFTGEGRDTYIRHRIGFLSGAILMVLGFALQLVDLLLG